MLNDPILPNPGDIAKLADTKLAHKAYDDLLARAADETGGLAADIVRLVRGPFWLAANRMERLCHYLARVGEKVPKEQQQEPAPSIAGPIIVALQFMEEESILTDMFLNLLARAIDTKRFNEAHPAFVKIIEQLCPDEALLLSVASLDGIVARKALVMEMQSEIGRCLIRSDRRAVFGSRIPFDVYIPHLVALNLVDWRDNKWDAQNHEWEDFRTGVKQGDRTIQTSEAVLSAFGQLFVRACLPDDFDIEQHKKPRQDQS